MPVLDEAASIELAVSRCREIADEVIVVDGGSSDATVETAERLECELVRAAKGRGQQLHAGAASATGDILLFLHADASLAPAARSQILDRWNGIEAEDQSTFYGCFQQQIESPKLVFRCIEKGNYWRAKYQKLPYGDQGIFVSRVLYDRVGGMPQIPLLEDFEFARKVSAIASPMVLPGPISVNARRWLETGPLRQTIRNWTIAARYRMGASPEELLEKY